MLYLSLTVMIILIHSSKTMRIGSGDNNHLDDYTEPCFTAQASELADFIKSLNQAQISEIMKVSSALALDVQNIYATWEPKGKTPAISSFIGDIYSGLQAPSLSNLDIKFAQEHLRILSGLYGILRPLDLINPYKMEMAYKLKGFKISSLYKFWGGEIAKQISGHKVVLNLSSDEYFKAVGKHLKAEQQVITPKFLTLDAGSNQPKFMAVHAKIARGSFANWMIKNRITKVEELSGFSQIGYKFSPKLSLSLEQPVFVCQEFGGKGLSLRLS